MKIFHMSQLIRLSNELKFKCVNFICKYIYGSIKFHCSIFLFFVLFWVSVSVTVQLITGKQLFMADGNRVWTTDSMIFLFQNVTTLPFDFHSLLFFFSLNLFFHFVAFYVHCLYFSIQVGTYSDRFWFSFFRYLTWGVSFWFNQSFHSATSLQWKTFRPWK